MNLDRLALPLFVVALVVASFFIPHPHWVLSLDGVQRGTTPIGSHMLLAPDLPKDLEWHRFDAALTGVAMRARVSIVFRRSLSEHRLRVEDEDGEIVDAEDGASDGNKALAFATVGGESLVIDSVFWNSAHQRRMRDFIEGDDQRPPKRRWHPKQHHPGSWAGFCSNDGSVCFVFDGKRLSAEGYIL